MTRRRGGILLAALFLSIVLLAWLASRGTAPRGPDPREDPSGLLPTEGLRASLAGRDLAALLPLLRALPVYRGMGSRLVPAVQGVDGEASGALGMYARGWARVTAGGRGSSGWSLASSDGSLEERVRDPRSRPTFLPERGFSIRIEPRAYASAGGSERSIEALFARVLPESLSGGILPEAGGLLVERWRVDCPSGCGLDVLARDAPEGAEARGWAAVPPDADAVVWVRVDPSRFGAGGPGALLPLEPLERFLDLPLRDAIARSLSGPAILVLEDPIEGGAPRFLAVCDLARPDEARATLDRVFALGMLADALEVRLYRGARVAAWRISERLPDGPTVAIDGDLLLLAGTAREVRDAIDRRRDGSGGGRALRPRLEALPRGSWKAWSRSGFTAVAWEEILGGWRSVGVPRPFEVTSYGRFVDGGFVLESRGTAPALASEPLVPAVRFATKQLRREADER